MAHAARVMENTQIGLPGDTQTATVVHAMCDTYRLSAIKGIPMHSSLS